MLAPLGGVTYPEKVFTLSDTNRALVKNQHGTYVLACLVNLSLFRSFVFEK